jgi:hypothetical protein
MKTAKFTSTLKVSFFNLALFNTIITSSQRALSDDPQRQLLIYERDDGHLGLYTYIGERRLNAFIDTDYTTGRSLITASTDVVFFDVEEPVNTDETMEFFTMIETAGEIGTATERTQKLETAAKIKSDHLERISHATAMLRRLHSEIHLLDNAVETILVLHQGERSLTPKPERAVSNSINSAGDTSVGTEEVVAVHVPT